MRLKELRSICAITEKKVELLEKMGIIAPDRSLNGYREFSEQDVTTVQTVLQLQKLGIRLKDIRDIFLSGEPGEDLEHRLGQIYQEKKQEIKALNDQILKLSELIKVSQIIPIKDITSHIPRDEKALSDEQLHDRVIYGRLEKFGSILEEHIKRLNFKMGPDRAQFDLVDCTFMRFGAFYENLPISWHCVKWSELLYSPILLSIPRTVAEADDVDVNKDRLWWADERFFKVFQEVWEEEEEKLLLSTKGVTNHLSDVQEIFSGRDIVMRNKYSSRHPDDPNDIAYFSVCIPYQALHVYFQHVKDQSFKNSFG